MMYENLIKRLRNCASDTVEDCAGCPYIGGYNGTYCMNGLITEAADAIEVLSKKEKTTQWIPVTKRLSEDGKFVLVCNDDGHMMIAKHETETYEWYYKYTNYDFDIWDNEEQGPVRYWMPLPEPPKEESNGV